MNKAVYEKPEFDFNDLFLFDGVAAKCWGYHAATYTIQIYRDANHDNKYDSSEEVLATRTYEVKEGTAEAQSCDSVYLALKGFLDSVHQEYDKAYVETKAFKENAGNTEGTIAFIPIS